MRISAGKYKGRVIADMRSTKAHPMSERIKTALFNSLGDITGLTVLDAFGGSGSLGLEALSRGADQVTICELDKKAAKLISENVKLLKALNQAKVINMNAYSYIERTDNKYDLIFLDPPFGAYESEKQKIQEFERLMRPNSVLVLSFPSDKKLPDIEKLVLLRQATYGNAALAFYKTAKP